METFRMLSASSDRSKILDLITSRTNLLGMSITSMGMTALWDGITARLLTPVPSLSQMQQTALAYAILAGALDNTSYPATTIVSAFANFETQTRYLVENTDKKLCDMHDPFFNLSDNVKASILRSPLATDSCMSKFLTLVSSFLGRQVSVSDFSGTGSIPLVNVSFNLKGSGLETKKYPEFFKALTSSLSEVIDVLDDEAKHVKLQTFAKFASSIIKSFTNEHERISRFCSIYIDIMANFLLKTKPPSFNIEERTLWLSECRNKVVKHIDLYYNYKAPHISNEEMLKNIDILPQDNLHSLAKILVSVIGGKRVGEKQDEYNQSVEYMVDIIISIRNLNNRLGVTLIQTLDICLLYFSIHGTSVNRVAAYPKKYEVLLSGRSIALDMSVVNEWVAKSRMAGINYIRLGCRCFATRTLLLRRITGLRYNPFKSLSTEDPLFTYDTVNFLNVSELSNSEYATVSRISRFISYAEKRTKDIGAMYSC